ncbi:MAG: SMC family ATPase [Bacteroidota bacterium]
MVPVELKLSNFLSYGEDSQTLDFSQFHVACLSGKNGQGKSALLDAITWVLWGQGRKSSGGHKPDEELLRIGSRRMQVELVFDVEGVRYRVMRAYQRSATGKTSKATMELQVLDTETAEGRPITRSSIRETEHALDEILGLDYNTFINSAFLLQGRSDEFTKKKPNERKEILGRILNLGKYDRLALMARDQQRKLKGELDVIQREIERLTTALEPEEEWKTQAATVAEELSEKQAALDGMATEEAALVEQLGALEAQAVAAANLEAAIKRYVAQKNSIEQERVQLEEKITRANTLTAKTEDIELQYKTFNSLVEEREQLDSSREVYRGIERMIAQKKQALQQLQLDMEQKIRHIELDLKKEQHQLTEIERQLEEKPKFEEALQKAKAAQARVGAKQEVLVQQDARKEQINNLEKAIAGKRELVVGQLQGMKDRLATLQGGTDELKQLTAEKERLTSSLDKQKTLLASVEVITKDGQQLGESIKSLEGELGILVTESARIEKQLAALEDLATSKCPTCGTSLTASHREEVAGELKGQITTLQNRMSANEATITQHKHERTAMRETFREVRTQLDALEGSGEKLAATEQKLASLAAQNEERLALEQKVGASQAQLDSRSFAVDEIEKLARLQQEFEAQQGGLGDLEADRFSANQVERYEEQLRAVLLAEGRKEVLVEKIAGLQKQIIQAREKLAHGADIAALKEETESLEARLKEAGFNPDRFEAVRRQIKTLEEAPNAFKDLLHARQNLVDWQAQKAKIMTQVTELDTQEAASRTQFAELQEQLARKTEFETQLGSMKLQRQNAEQAVRALQVHSGELQAKLSQAKEDRSARAAGRSRSKELKREENLYSKLRQAFSKQGIPSLIIEQALPELEDRANDLLNRLADGKMRVGLETLRDKKSGGTKETLEIIITDEQGVPRPYETFSGGEAFRVNFALRIALSQMLAERSGVRIRTLGIDEGFGTQDEEGIQNLIEALQVIQEDFDKILVITHLDRLKEAFPVRIEVVKHPVEGSRFTVMQN